MPRDDYQRALDAACKEYEALHTQRTAIDTRLAQITETIATLNTLCGYVPTVPLGLTDACRMILRNAPKPMTTTEVRDRLAAIGVNLDRYANALSAVHTTIKRMVEGREAAAVDLDDTERVAYEFLPSGLVASRTHALPGTTHRHAAHTPHVARRKKASP